MAYDFLELVNSVNRRLNEVELSSAQFPTAKGWYAQCKDAVNSSIRDIQQTHYQWPFNHTTQNVTLVAGTMRYAFPADVSNVDMDSFRVRRNNTFGNETVRLRVMTYDEYLQLYVDYEYDTSNTSIRDVPEFVVKAPDDHFIVTPPPKEAYVIDYEYFQSPVDLSLYNDTTTVPEKFKHVIVDGAMYYAYMFRSNEQAASLAKAKFDEGLKKMRILLINEYEYLRSTYIPQGAFFIAGPRLG
jgi:hypothetical protein